MFDWLKRFLMISPNEEQDQNTSSDVSSTSEPIENSSTTNQSEETPSTDLSSDDESVDPNIPRPRHAETGGGSGSNASGGVGNVGGMEPDW